jgi:hypothetical protein
LAKKVEGQSPRTLEWYQKANKQKIIKGAELSISNK